MPHPIQINFVNIEGSEELKAMIEKYAEKLDRFYGRITKTKIIVEMPHKNHHRGNTFQVRIDLTVPGSEICVRTDADTRLEYRDVEVAVRDAFDIAKRRLEDYAKSKRNKIKRRAVKLEEQWHQRVCSAPADADDQQLPIFQ